MGSIAISGSGGAAGTPNWINVKGFGAKGDGVTDDTAAISAAIATMPSTGSVLYFPAGTYLTSGGFTISNPATVRGDGVMDYYLTSSVSTVLCNSTTAVLFTFTTTIAQVVDLAMECTVTGVAGSSAILANSALDLARLDLENVFVDGFYDSVDYKVGAQCVMHRCIIQNSVHYGVRIRNTVNNDDGGDIIDSCSFLPAATCVTCIQWESCGAFHVTNCGLAPNNVTMPHGIVLNAAGTTSQIEIIGNGIDGCTDVGISVNLNNLVNGLTIDNNFIRTTSSSVSAINVTNAKLVNIGSNVLWAQISPPGTQFAVTVTNSTIVTVGRQSILNFAAPFGGSGNTSTQIARIILSATGNYYVDNSAGSDSNPGIATAPFATLQHAWDYLSGAIDGNSNNVTITLAASATPYLLFAKTGWLGVGNVAIIGAGRATTTINNCLFAAPNFQDLNLGASVTIDGVTFNDANVGSGAGAALWVQVIGNVVVGSTGAVAFSVSHAGTFAYVYCFGASGLVQVYAGSTLSGNSQTAFWADTQAQIYLVGGAGTYTITGTPAYSVSFAFADELSILFSLAGTFSGAATGSRFTLQTNSVYATSVPDPAGTFFPGNAVGAITGGGQYQGITDFIGIVASLPSANIQGTRAFVTDALTATFGSAPTGGHATFVPVYNNGTAWLMG